MPIFRRTRNFYRRIRRYPIGYVHLTIRKAVPTYKQPRSFIEKRLLPTPPYAFGELWEKSEHLIKKDKVKGLIVHLRSLDADMADYHSIRQLLQLWKEADKPVWIYANNYSTIEYYLASVADKIFIIPGGTLNVIGVALSASFFKSFLNERGIETQVIQVTPYKSAFNSFTRDEIPEEQQENLEWMRDAVYSEIVEKISEGREKSREEVEEFIDNCPMSGEKAEDQGWIDGILTPGGIIEKVDKQKEENIVEFDDAYNRVPMPKKPDPNIAIIPIEGNIIDGKSRNRKFPFPILGDKRAGDLTVTQVIRQVREESNIKGALIYVNSPGGSATASEAILSELGKLSQEMPVVAYFHNVAASGGYYVGMNATKIVASPLSITGSIGVVNGKISIKPALDDRKINRIEISKGKNATIRGIYGLWTEEQKEKMEDLMFRVYDVFRQHVAKNRDMDLDNVTELAGGRVWLGNQAFDHGLVDQLGSIHDAVQILADEADIDNPRAVVVTPPDELLPPTELPQPDMWIEELKNIAKQFNGNPQYLLPISINFDF